MSPCILLTCFGFFLSASIWQETFTAEIIESDDDFVQPAAGAAQPAAGAVGGAGGRGGRGGGSVRAGGKGRSAVPDEDDDGPGSRRSATQPEVRVLGMGESGE